MTRRSQEDIGKLLQSYRERGDLTRHAFCEKQEISLSTIGYHLRRYGKPAEKRVGLARVELNTAEAPSPLVVILANGRRVECGAVSAVASVLVAYSDTTVAPLEYFDPTGS